MKGERRHELQTNVLADWLANKVEVIKPYRHAILAVVLLVAVVWAWYAWWSSRSTGRTERGSNLLFAAMDGQKMGGFVIRNPADFEKIVQQYPETNVAFYAGVVAGDLRLRNGCNFLLTDKIRAYEELKKAVEHYLTVRKQSDLPDLRQRAAYGLARAREAQGQLADARKLYEEVSTNWPNGAYSAAAAARLRELNKPSTEAFYAWLAESDRRPSGADGPPAPGVRIPFTPDSLPDGPVFPAPGTTFDFDLRGQKPEEKKSQDKPDTPTKTDETKPSKPKPTEPKPIEPKPTEPKAIEPKPDEPKPIEPKPIEPKAIEPKAIEPKPDEAKPDEPKPDEPKPTKPKSVDSTEKAPKEPAATETPATPSD